FAECANKEIRPFQQRLFEAINPNELAAVRKSTGNINRRSIFQITPTANRVVILERETNRIHQVVATRAIRTGTMFGKTLPNRQAFGKRIFLQRRRVRRRRWRRRAEQIAENPMAANDRRSARRVGSDTQNTPLPQEAAAVIFLGQSDAPKT